MPAAVSRDARSAPPLAADRPSAGLPVTPELRAAWRAAVLRQAGGIALESGAGFGESGRWSIYAWRPAATFEIRGPGFRWRLEGVPPCAPPAAGAAAWAALSHLWQHTPAAPAGPRPFAGGWLGYLGYDLAPMFETLPRRGEPRGAMPEAWFGYYPNAVVVDEHAQRAWPANGCELPAAPAATSAADPGGPATMAPPAAAWSPAEYRGRAARVIEYLRAGDIFQANLAQRFSACLKPEWRSPAGWGWLWERLRGSAPAPFSAFLRGRDWAALSASPERFLLAEPDGRVETRPIKGTRPRGAEPVADAAFAAELLASAKDRAELAMIVDLERNDLGRTCRYGSVRVLRHAALESHANVHHLVSVVEGRRRPDVALADVLAGAFPGGSISGAPKVRALEIIDELEGFRRGLYTGCIGYVSACGRADFNIAIRTLTVAGAAAEYCVGGGIVVDSDPEAERLETLAKGSKLFAALAGEDGP